jgi:hypothetical protein
MAAARSRPEQRQEVAPVDEQRQRLPESPAEVPALGDHQAQPGTLATGRASPEQAHGNEVGVEGDVGGRDTGQGPEPLRHPPVDALAEQAATPLQKEHRSR